MATGGWEALTDLMNELIAIDNHQSKPLNTELLRFRIRTSFGQRALNQLKRTSDLRTTPSRKWVRKEFLDIILSYPTQVPKSLVLGACTSASTTPDRCWMWGGLEVQGIKEATLAIKQHNDYNNGITSSPPLPSEEFLKGSNFIPANQSASSLEIYSAFRAQEPDHRPATQQQVGQSQASAVQSYGTQQVGGFTSGYSHGHASQQQPAYSAVYPGYRTQCEENLGSSSISQASALQPYGAQEAGGFTSGYSHGHASQQRPVHPAVYPGYRTQVIVQIPSQSWAMQPSTGQISATQSYVGHPSGGYAAVHLRGSQSGQRGQGGQDDQYYHDQGSDRYVQSLTLPYIASLISMSSTFSRFPMDHTRFKNRDGDYSLVPIVPHRIAKGSFNTLSFIFHGNL
ncbi:hypothetical protein BOTNAR_0535g00090 [Botryotinia narcissicola]|uniref:Uncharacterized protein n=1 Tax=Botryotinia narcissicola TaxID=278944 RepID=A0A4Z1HQX1_9HELO|nr:hypothetical protein BOTNAR_0535g00090 [Botryotinia narcissicola]